MSQYHFITNWKLRASAGEVYRLLEDVDALTEWWPSVYLDVKVLEKGQSGGVGKLVELYTKGWLPYTLRWKFRVVKTALPSKHWAILWEAENGFFGTLRTGTARLFMTGVSVPKSFY